MKRWTRSILAMVAASLPAAALAEAPINLSSSLFVERASQSAGTSRLKLEPASRLEAGDRVVLLLDWNAAQGRPFTLTSALPAGLMFQRSSADDYEISVDGGRSWGHLGTLRITDSRGDRIASPEDVTHLRVRVPASEAARGRGRISYRAIVR